MLLGRVTYEQFVAAWPSRTDDTGFADKINSLPKHVASRTLDRVEWNAKLLGEPLVEEIGRLKEEPGGDLVVHGSANLVQTLLAANLVDQLNLLVYPLVLGKGQRLFPGGIKAGFKLVEATPVDTGVIISIYERIEE